jgi:CRP-like cAMP-binding protein
LPRNGAPISNRLLDELPERDCARVLAAGECVELSFPDVLAEPGGPMPHVYFPLTSFISLVVPMGGKNHVEVALAGNEGFWGVGLAMGVAASPAHALVQGSGQAIRIEAAAFERELARMPSLRSCINRYAYVVMIQLIQTAGCNRFHVVEQRLARWLLMTADRSHSASFHITHEFLAYMLGVRRVGVTKAASALQQRQLISYARGSVTILDRKGLQRASCSCYRCDLTTYARVFG